MQNTVRQMSLIWAATLLTRISADRQRVESKDGAPFVKIQRQAFKYEGCSLSC